MTERSSRLTQMLGKSSLGESIGSRSDAGSVPSPLSLGTDRGKGRSANRNAVILALDQIIPDPDQPRKVFDPTELRELAESIAEHDLLQPIRVRWADEHEKWIIVAGERRYRAAQLLQHAEIQATIDSTDRTVGEVRVQQLVENIQRSNFRPCEEAKAFAEAMELEGISASELSRRIKKSRSYVSESLLLLQLSEEQQQQVDAGTLPVREAYRLARDAKAVDSGKSPTPKKSTSVGKKGKRKRGTEVTYRASNGAKIVVTFGKKADDTEIRDALLDIAKQIAQSQQKSKAA